ncbi:hypothetical protein DPMN_109246 [Dreissena polymorpha]|uniref:LRAT domain-containing protein n=1 Tax=Dreissena polymorpha TaxID=45954 RepID=A0A9D4KAA4_DREPO|nr:hypothetical protein DPMN_109246 [Dreissena polymorpha]
MAFRSLRHQTHVQADVTDEALEELLLDNERAIIEAQRARIVFERQDFNTRNAAFENEPKHAFQARGNRTKIDKNNVGVLQPGDHVSWHRNYIIWHHAIVLKVDRHRNKLFVIQWQKVNDGNSKGNIVEQWIDSVSQKGEFYRIDYENDVTESNPHALVLYRARCEVGKTNYQYLKNNGETFATFCKTGNRDGCQENWFTKIVQEALIVAEIR